MRSKTLVLSAIALAGLSGVAQGAAFKWTGAVSNVYSLPGNWVDAGTNGAVTEYPGQNRNTDTVVIPNVALDPVLNVDVQIALLEVQSSAILRLDDKAMTVAATAGNGFEVEPGAVIEIEQNDGRLILTGANLAHDMGGTIQLENASSELRFDSANVTLQPVGGGQNLIVGLDDDARINIPDAGDDFISLIGVEGRMEFIGSGQFHNQEYVKATSGVISFAATLDLLDADNAGEEWEAANSGSQVRILKEYTLAGDFFTLLTNGIYHEEDLTTTGSFNNPSSNCSGVTGPNGMVFTWGNGSTFCVAP